MPGKAAFLALFLLLATGSAREALSQAAGACPTPTGPPAVAVDLRFREPEIVHSVASVDFEPTGAPLPAGHREVGQARLGSRIDFDIQVASGRDHEGRLCYLLRRIRVAIEARPMVHVGREFPVGSCPYRVIMAHEARHIAIHRDVLGRLAQAIEQKLPSAPTLLGRGRARDATAVKADVEARVMAEIGRIKAPLQAEADRRNAALDSRENYRAEVAKCAPAEWQGATAKARSHARDFAPEPPR